MKDKVLVTGGAGYIGSHACKALHAAGIEPVTLDNLVFGHSWAVKWGPLLEGDLADRALLKRIFAEHSIKAVMHFAAYTYVGESVQQPEKYFSNNVVNTLNLLEAMLNAGVRDIVFSSTCAVYGDPQVLPLTEDHAQNPVNPYGETKRMIERALHWYGRANQLRSVSLRYFNAAGADPAAEIGEDHDPETHLIPLVIQAAMGLLPEVKVFGTDYATPDGSAVRDYIHVSDLAAAHVRALEYLWQGGASTAFNLGTGNGLSVLEIIHAVENTGGCRVPYTRSERREGDPAILVANADLAGQQLQWQPQCSDVDSIVKSAWSWHQRHHKQMED